MWEHARAAATFSPSCLGMVPDQPNPQVAGCAQVPPGHLRLVEHCGDATEGSHVALAVRLYTIICELVSVCRDTQKSPTQLLLHSRQNDSIRPSVVWLQVISAGILVAGRQLVHETPTTTEHPWAGAVALPVPSCSSKGGSGDCGPGMTSANSPSSVCNGTIPELIRQALANNKDIPYPSPGTLARWQAATVADVAGRMLTVCFTCRLWRINWTQRGSTPPPSDVGSRGSKQLPSGPRPKSLPLVSAPGSPLHVHSFCPWCSGTPAAASWGQSTWLSKLSCGDLSLAIGTVPLLEMESPSTAFPGTRSTRWTPLRPNGQLGARWAPHEPGVLPT